MVARLPQYSAWTITAIVVAAMLAPAACASQDHRSVSTPTVLVWVPGGVPDALAASVSDVEGVTTMSEVLGGTLDLVSSVGPDGHIITQTTDDRSIPLDTLSYDPATFRYFTDEATAEQISSLGSGDAIIGATSAELRGVGVGGSLRLGSGHELTISAVLDDDRVAAAEVVVAPQTARELGVGTRRFVLAHVSENIDDGAERIRSQVPDDDPLRVVDASETMWTRHGDQVMPQSIVKQRFGEFSSRPAEDGTLSIDPQWVKANVVTETVPLLGTVSCHRLIIEPLKRALGKLEAQGYGDAVDRRGYKGCFYPRRIDGMPYLSRHSWGIALDLNIADDVRGRDVDFDPELVGAMEQAGFRNGADWPLPDPAHFEWQTASTRPVGE